MNVQERTFTAKLRSCKTTFNNLYWGFLQTKQQEWWQEIAIQYRKKNNSILHIVAFLYKLHISKSIKSITYKPQPAVVETPPKPAVVETPPKPAVVETPPQPAVVETPPKPAVVETPPQPSVVETSPKPVVVEEPVIKKQRFLGAIRHTPLSNYKEWRKAKMGMKTSEKVETKIFSKWKIEDNFDPKKYNKNIPWFNYIDENMI